MKNNLKKYLLFLPVLPMLMGNAPAPTAHPKNYTDFEVSIINEEEVVTAYTTYNYTYHIKNKGVGYISSVSVFSKTKDSNGYRTNYAFIHEETIDPLFPEVVIPANSEIDITCSRSERIKDLTDFDYSGHAYFDFADDVTVSGTYTISKCQNWSGYSVDMELSGGDTNKYDYGAILKLTYDGNEHYVHVDQYQQFSFSVKEGFEKSKLTKVEVMKVTRSVSYSYGCRNAWNAIQIFAIVIFVCFIFLVSCGIFCAIFFPIMKKKKRERREKKNEQL